MEFASPTVEGQTEQVLKNLREILVGMPARQSRANESETHTHEHHGLLEMH